MLQQATDRIVPTQTLSINEFIKNYVQRTGKREPRKRFASVRPSYFLSCCVPAKSRPAGECDVFLAFHFRSAKILEAKAIQKRRNTSHSKRFARMFSGALSPYTNAMMSSQQFFRLKSQNQQFD